MNFILPHEFATAVTFLCFSRTITAETADNAEIFIDTDFSRASNRRVVPFSMEAVYTPKFAMDIETSDPDYRSISKSDLSYHIVHPDRAQLSVDDVNQLRSEGKIVLAYLSVGEAEVWLDYWREDWIPGVIPLFLERVNDRFRDRYKIRFWMEEWQEILLNYMENHILRKGYSGLYLDAVDVYTHFLAEGNRPAAADDMIQLVGRIRRWGQSLNSDLLVFVNNAVELYGNADYVSMVDGLVAQDTWYRDNIPLRNVDAEHTDTVVRFLRSARNDGKPVLAVDYPTETEKICDFYVKCSTEAFRCAVFAKGFPGAVITPLTC
ncbi:uncharacterized protein TM_1410-like [Paramacrobiotus metropolitanus]|uniref:uncharacterized protein TM_1410-like n=1 Tax=Paramacrobiotus metropolitanus TaxID=2943436 RepID=UPI00244588C3|nr:uncharacterized protein TM_1410-like [Paramacrobiotus metropolitanus]